METINKIPEDHDEVIKKNTRKALRKALANATTQMEQTGKISKSTGEIIKGLVRILSNV